MTEARQACSRGSSNGVEDKLGDIGDLFEDAIDDAKKDVRREVSEGQAPADPRDARDEMEKLHAEFADKMA